MLYRALVSFAGAVSMVEGEAREILEPSLVSDLMKAGYIEPIAEEDKGKQPKRKAVKKD